jgi:ribonuclease HII
MPLICGLDEAGRGPLAGPVCAAAVILPEDFPFDLLNDSKKLSEAKRMKVLPIILENAIAYGIGWASPAEIDDINILQASLLAMKRAFFAMQNLDPSMEIESITDGLYVPDIPVKTSAMVKADAKIPAVMAASILAKTARDRVMERYSWLYPEYGYEKHKGYPTKEHYARIAQFGVSPIQRHSFSLKKIQLELF